MIAARAQAIYFLFMGLWPLLHYRSFEAVTGKKIDTWLVKTIAWLFIVIGVQLWTSDPQEMVLLGLGSAFAVGAADIYYSFIKQRISWVYTLDALPQIIFVILWLVSA